MTGGDEHICLASTERPSFNLRRSSIRSKKCIIYAQMPEGSKPPAVRWFRGGAVLLGYVVTWFCGGDVLLVHVPHNPLSLGVNTCMLFD
jgi:hypothetical protein